MKSDDASKNYKISEAVLMAMAPALAYYSAFMYSKAYFSAFGLPSDLVRVELTTVLAFAAALIAIVVTVITIINPLFTMVGTEEERNNKPILKLIWLYMPMIIFVAMYLYVYDFGLDGLIMCGVLLAAMFLLHIFPALILRHKAPTFNERLNIELSSGMGGQTIFSVIRSNYGKSLSYAAVFIILGINLATAMGRAEAMKKKTFYVPNSHPNLLVAKMYSDKAICISIDNSGVINDGFYIINTTQDNIVNFRLIKIPIIKIK